MKTCIKFLVTIVTSLQLIGCGSSSGGASGPTEPTDTSTPTTTLPIAGSIACPVNSTNETATTLSDCTSKPGYYDCSSGTCKDVGAGYYSLGGDNTRTQCPAGSYSTGLNNAACVACGGGTFQSSAGQTSCGVCTNAATNASSVIYDNAQTGLTTNSCTITDVTCSQYYTKSGVSCVANTVDAPSGATRTPAASITTNSSTVTATVDANTTNLTLYSDSGCTAQIGTGTAAQAASGITITGLTDQTTNVYGKATNSVTGQESACTSLTTFKYWPSDTFTATYTNTNPLVACDGTQNVTQNLTSCIGDNTGISDNSKCATTSSVSMQSPAGTKNVAITNGTRHDTCALGSSTVSSVALTCDGGAYKSKSNLLCLNPSMALNNSANVLLFNEQTNSIYLGGYFTYYNGENLGGSYKLIKVNASTGVRDTNFAIVFVTGYLSFNAVKFDSTNNYIYAGGDFTGIGGQSRTSIAKINATTGSVDTTFNANSEINSWSFRDVFSLVEDSSNLYLAGNLQHTNVYGVAKFNKTTGAVDSSFKTNSANVIKKTNATFDDIKINSGILYLGGNTGDPGDGWGNSRFGIVALNTDGTLYSSFNSGLTSWSMFSLDIVSGWLYATVGNLMTIKRYNLTTGAVDSSFTAPVVDSQIQNMKFYGNSVYVGNDFSQIGSTNTRNLAKLNATTGALDTGFVVAPGSVPGTNNQFEVLGEMILMVGGNSPYIKAINSTTGASIW